jgi:hypothetical protein
MGKILKMLLLFLSLENDILDVLRFESFTFKIIIDIGVVEFTIVLFCCK